MCESRAYTTRPDCVVPEQSKELVGRVLLHLAVLCRSALQELIQLDGLVCRNACFILGCLAAEPEEDIVAELVVADFVGVEHDEAVSVVELAGFFFRPGDYLEVFDAPDCEAWCLADVLPGGFGEG